MSNSWSLTARYVFPANGAPLDGGVSSLTTTKLRLSCLAANAPPTRPRQRRRHPGPGKRPYSP